MTQIERLNGSQQIEKIVGYLSNYMQGQSDHLWKSWIGRAVKPYFLAPYKEVHLDSWVHDTFVERKVNGKEMRVERYMHGFAHSLRQGALARDMFCLLGQLKAEESLFTTSEAQGIIDWAHKKLTDKDSALFLKKLELVSSFQRSGRESDISYSTNREIYKRYEKQDTINFILAAKESGIFDSDLEIQLFSKSLLWANPGVLDEGEHEDLKYLRCFLQSAHTLDLRRSAYFDEKRLRQDALGQLFGTKDLSLTGEYETLIEILWNRSGQYLEATGDTDQVGKRGLSDLFFIQTKDPYRLVNAIQEVAAKSIHFPNSKRKEA